MDPNEIIAEAEREEQEYYQQYCAAYEAYIAAATGPPPRLTRSNRRYIPRDREGAHERLIHDYFSDMPQFSADYFWHRFRMSKRLFLRIVNTLSARVEYFQSRTNVTGKQSLSVLQKCTCAIRQLATGQTANMFDEYLHVGESTGILCLKIFCTNIRSAFGEEFLHISVHGFPVCLVALTACIGGRKIARMLGGATKAATRHSN